MDDLLKNVKLSIIIPVYKGEKYIASTLDKVFQIPINKEVIIVNDASPDNSLSILKSYGDQIILINLKENHGAAYARNQGLKIATGNYISFMDQDDDFELDMHVKILTKMIKDQADVGICNYNEINFDGTVQQSKYNLDFENLSQPDVIRLYLQNQIVPLIWVSVYSSSLAKSISFDSIYLGEDVIYQFRIILNATKTCFVNEPLYHYVKHSSSMTNSAKLSDFITAHLKIADSISAEEKSMLNETYAVEYEFFRLSLIQNWIHAISALDGIKRREGKELIRKILNREICNKIIKNPYTARCIKLEFWILKTFGIGFHLFMFPVYQLLRRIFLPKGIQGSLRKK